MAAPIHTRDIPLDALYARAKVSPSIHRILEILGQVFPTPDGMRIWLHRPLPDLGGRTPVEVILLGHPDAVRDMLEAALIGTPS